MVLLWLPRRYLVPGVHLTHRLASTTEWLLFKLLRRVDIRSVNVEIIPACCGPCRCRIGGTHGRIIAPLKIRHSRCGGQEQNSKSRFFVRVEFLYGVAGSCDQRDSRVRAWSICGDTEQLPAVQGNVILPIASHLQHTARGSPTIDDVTKSHVESP
jgi:hypothetical protein